ncbi:MAG: TonB-dependent receptor, partial [Prevotellaceae bacterium]|nr:TonB-dependent receptor [Prevotellaceae bacterium]
MLQLNSRTLATLFFCFTAGVSMSQTVRGKVIDRQTGLPVAAAVVTEKNTQRHAVSGNGGSFVFDTVALGRQSFFIQCMGYEPQELLNVSVDAGREVVLEIRLDPEIVALGEVVVKAAAPKNRPVNEMAMNSARSFSVEETERYAGSLGDPSRMAANFAGVVASGDQRNDIIIRGNSPMGVLWRVDGFTIPNPNHFGAVGTSGGPVGMLNNNLLKTSDFYTGAFPAEFGNALSGAFDIHLREGNTNKYQFTGQVGFNGFEFGVEGPVSKKMESSFLLNYRYSTLAVFDALNINMGLGRAVPQYQDVSFKATVGKTAWGEWSLFGIAGTSHIELIDSENDGSSWSYGFAGQDTYFGSDMAVTGLTNRKTLSDNTVLETRLSWQGQRNTTKIDTLSQALIPSPQYRSFLGENKYVLSSKIKTRFDSKNILAGGFSYDLIQPILDDKFFTADNRSIVLRDSKILTSKLEMFGEYRRAFSSKLSVYGGLHYIHLFFNSTGSFEPRMGINYRLNSKHSFNFGYGLHGQQQSFLFYLLEKKLP